MQEIKIKCKGADSLPIDTIKDFQGKLKHITRDNLERLKVSILKNGFVAPIFVWRNEGQSMALDGHQRIKALLSMRDEGYEIPLLPVAYIEADNEDDARQKLLAITSQYGEFDIDELNSWVSNLDAEIAETLRFANDKIELDVEEIETEGDDEFEDEIEPITKLGDLWELGDHRVLCADSTEISNVMDLINNQRIDFVFTDPPYGIEIVRNNSIGGSKPFGKGKNGFDSIVKAGEYEPIKGDSTIETAMACYDISKEIKAKIILLWGGNFYAHRLPPAKCWVIWDKETDGNFGDGEIAWCSDSKSIRIFRHKWSGMIKASEHGEKRKHPTQKPIALAEWAIKEFMKSDQFNILDFFGGAGFTLIAAEKLHKISFICELSEHYCDVIVKRYTDWCIKNEREYIIKLNGKAWQ